MSIRRFDPRPSAFTLIELLIVVAIIGLLLAILLPGLRSARAMGKRTACLAKTRDLVVAWDHFLNDQNDRFPIAPRLEWTYGGQEGTGMVAPPAGRPLNRYLGIEPVIGRFEPTTSRRESNRIPDAGAKFFHCPADIGSQDGFAPYIGHYGNSYLANPLLVMYSFVVPPGAYGPVFMNFAQRRGLVCLPRSRVDVDHARLVLLGDGAWWNSWLPGMAQAGAAWHDKAGHFSLGFLDGHAAFTEIRAGIGSSHKYSIMPFASLDADLQSAQDIRP